MMKVLRGAKRRGVFLEKFVGIKQDGDRAVVHDLNGHVRLKNSSCDAYSQRLQGAHKLFIQRLA
jgi:hypothetical protein